MKTICPHSQREAGKQRLTEEKIVSLERRVKELSMLLTVCKLLLNCV